jgi:hypothetical protein
MKEITGIFQNKQNLDQAFEKLKELEITKDDINLLARENKIRASLGEDYKSVRDLNSKTMPRINYVSEKLFHARENIFITILFYIGVISAVSVTFYMQESIGVDIAVAFFAGISLQLVGILVSGLFRKRHGDYIERKLNKGGLVFWIKIENNKNKQNEICKILKKFKAKKVRVIHSL